MTAARYLGVAPWELYRQPLYWREWALAARNAEAEAEAAQAEQSSSGAGNNGGRREL